MNTQQQSEQATASNPTSSMDKKITLQRSLIKEELQPNVTETQIKIIPECSMS